MTLRERIAQSLAQEVRAGGPVVLLVAGRAGCGKSSTVNSLLGQDQAKVSLHERGTDRVNIYPREVAGIEFLIVDTPGLGDPESQDERTIAALQALKLHVNCLLYVTGLDQPRHDAIDSLTLNAFSEIFPQALKEHSVIVLTKADLVPTADFPIKVHKWKHTLRRLLATACKITIWRALDTPVVVISNGRRLNPDGEEWLDELLAAVMDRSDRRTDIRIALTRRS